MSAASSFSSISPLPSGSDAAIEEAASDATRVAVPAGAELPAWPEAAVSPPLVRWRGREPYEVSFDAMRSFTESRTPDTPDEIWLVEHPPVFTLGQAGDPAHL